MASYFVTDNVIQVGVSDPALFRSIVTTIDAAPRPEFIEGIRVGHALVWKTSSTEIEVFDQPVVFTVTAEAGSNRFEATRT